MSSIHSEVVHRPGFGAQKLRQRIASADHEFIACTVLLAAALAIGLATAADYGITTDEFIFDGYGPKALAWYTSAFTDRSLFDHYDTYLYGPWFQTLVAIAQ
jgi:hypothetical protein